MKTVTVTVRRIVSKVEEGTFTLTVPDTTAKAAIQNFAELSIQQGKLNDVVFTPAPDENEIRVVVEDPTYVKKTRKPRGSATTPVPPAPAAEAPAAEAPAAEAPAAEAPAAEAPAAEG